MINLDRAGDSIVLSSPLVTKERARQIPGATWDSKRHVWRYPLSWATCVVARGVFGDELEIGPSLGEWAVEEKKRVDKALELRELR
jgi:hypothetical protein